MIDKRIVQKTLEKIQGVTYIFESQIVGLTSYVAHYLTIKYNHEDLEDSVRVGIKLYFNLMNKGE